MGSSHDRDDEKAELLNPDSFDVEGQQSPTSSRTANSEHGEEFDSSRKHELMEELAEGPPAVSQRRKRIQLILWMIVNTLATIAIVFTNKLVFDDPSFRNCQMSFASFHFFVTGLTLYTVSRPWAGMFVPKRAAIRDILPLGASMCFQVVLPNLSLAYSSVTFYQLARILLTPVVALLNYLLYGLKIPRAAAYTLIPVCIGVAIVSYYDSLPAEGADVKTTSFWGAIFAISGVGASSLYTVWIGYYHKKLQMSSMQLLLNQAPVGGLLLLYAIPWIDTAPEFSTVPFSMWTLIFMSGIFACLINLSQFFIIDQAGAVSSTVVGHLKTCTIVALGWVTSGRSVMDKSIWGIFMALAGIVVYSKIMLEHKKKQAASGGR